MSKSTFRLEREMAQPTKNWLTKEGLSFQSEFITPWGICDLVGYAFSKNRVKKRAGLRQFRSIGSRFRIKVLLSVPDVHTKKSITLSDLHVKFKGLLDPNALDEHVNTLATRRFLRFTRTGSLQRVNGWLPLQKRLVTVELKLARIEEAYRQGLAHAATGCESYVGLPMDRARRLVNCDRVGSFMEHGIGVLAVGARNCKVLLRAKPKNNRNSLEQLHFVERLWSHFRGTLA